MNKIAAAHDFLTTAAGYLLLTLFLLATYNSVVWYYLPPQSPFHLLSLSAFWMIPFLLDKASDEMVSQSSSESDEITFNRLHL